MLQKERNYDFRNRIDVVHLAGLNDSANVCQADEVAVDSSWRIIVPAGACEAVVETGKDLADYFAVSMAVNVHVENTCGKKIVLNLDSSLALTKGSFELDITPDCITISASEPGGIRRGGVYIEDQMSLRGAPILKAGKIRKEKLKRTRLHTGISHTSNFLFIC